VFPRLKILIAAILALSTPAWGQAVQQSGVITPNHLPYWVTNGVIADAGTSADSPVTSIGATGQICSNSARQSSGAWNSVCIQAFTNSAGVLSIQNYGSASPQNLQFLVNGTAVTVPTGGGNTFPSIIAPLVTNDAICANNTSGVLKDCGVAIAAGTQWGVLYYSTTGTTASTAAATNGQVFLGNTGGPPAPTTLSGDIGSVTAGGLVTIANSAVTVAKQANATAFSLEGNFTGGLAAPQFQTIGGLTQKASPAGTDLVLIQDQAASGALKYALISAVGSVGSVGSVNGLAGSVILWAPPQGRLSLTSGAAVMTSGVAAATVVYYVAYAGKNIPIYNGTQVAEYQICAANTVGACQLSVTMGSNWTTTSIYDWFVAYNGGTPTLCSGPAWTSSSARGTGAGTTQLAQIDGINSNAVQITCNTSNGSSITVAANQGTYVGTTLTGAAGQTNFVYGAASTGGTAALIGIWNAYNRVTQSTQVNDTTSSWTYAVANTWRAADNSATARGTFIRGLAEGSIRGTYYALAQAGSATNAEAGVGLDSTTAFCGVTAVFTISASLNSAAADCVATPGIGTHFLSAIEFNSTTTASTFFGAANAAGQTGLTLTFDY
jgi:hypothetical protein